MALLAVPRLAAVATALLVVGCAASPGRRLSGNPDEDECVEHLRTIHGAIQAYRRDHKDLPDFLSDLVPRYLPSSSTLICPVHRKTGVDALFQLDDPHLYTSYTYEFANRPVPKPIWGGSRMTMKAWRQRTMSFIGGATPIVRCHLHGHVINMSFDGEIYLSGTNWDLLPRFADKVRRADYRPDPP